MIRRIPRGELSGEAAPLSLAAHAVRTQRPPAARNAALTREQLTSALRALLSEELALKPEHVERVVERELSNLQRASFIELHVHPEDAEHVEKAANQDREAISWTLQIVRDSAVERGGCTLHSDVGDIDARVETRLEVAIELLRAGAFDAS